MCGIWAYFNKSQISKEEMTSKVCGFRSLVKTIRHRGPDWSGSYQADYPKQIYIAHERLAINGLSSGSQPFINNQYGLVLSVNGEIYNHLLNDVDCKDMGYKYITHSDCECIMYLYDYYMKEYETKLEKDGETDINDYFKQFMGKVDGIFTFVLYDYIRNRVIVARDPIGVNSLYLGYQNNNEIYISSEMKAIPNEVNVKIFPPSMLLWFNMDVENENNLEIKQNWIEYYTPEWKKSGNEIDLIRNHSYTKNIHDDLVRAVQSQMMTEVPFGVLLSGGLDSSLISSIAQKTLNENDKHPNRMWGDKIHTFSIGLEDSPDTIAAKKVAEHIGSIHHSFVFTLQEAEDALEDVIYHLESYDITTIRASTPMFLLARKIKAMGIKMVLSGEGSDEIFGGYLYFHHAPSEIEFHNECKTLISRLHYSDCLRANKSTMAWGVEVRVPFLDKSFLEVAVPVSQSLKIAPRDNTTNKNKRIEKYVLRKAFSYEETGYHYLPEDMLWRQKEQFSDGVGYSWIDHLKKITSERITDEEMEYEKEHNPEGAKTKEALYYMKIYDRLYPNRRNIIPRWKPRTDWNGITSDDPSGRAVNVHQQTF